MTVNFKNTKGSVTVEAAVILPVIMSLILCFLFLIKLVHTHVTIQHALNDTANQIASYSYLYSKSGLQKIHDSAKESLEDKGSQAEKDMELLAQSWDAFNEISGTLQKGGSFSSTDNLKQSLVNISESGSDRVQMLKGISELAKRAIANPKDEVISIGSLLGNSLFEDGKSLVIQPLIGYMVCRNLESGRDRDADVVLKQLSVADGIAGLDFSDSTIFKDKRTVDLSVKYKLRLLLPLKIFPDIYISQRSTVRAWLDGDGLEWAGSIREGAAGESGSDGENQQKGTDEESDKNKAASVWDLSPKTRGKIIQTEQGRNLPDMFPVVAKIMNGTVYSVKSIDLTDVTYRKTLNLKYRVNGFIKELSEFKEGEYRGTRLLPGDYRDKALVLVVPKDSLNAANTRVLAECRKYAESLNVTFTVIEHSQKKSEG